MLRKNSIYLEIFMMKKISLALSQLLIQLKKNNTVRCLSYCSEKIFLRLSKESKRLFGKLMYFLQNALKKGAKNLSYFKPNDTIMTHSIALVLTAEMEENDLKELKSLMKEDGLIVKQTVRVNREI